MYYIGCSGFYYSDWKGTFYPDNIPKKQWLSYYASKFNALELNSSFYRIPKPEKIKSWYNETPSDFRMAVKGHRYMTQLKKLKVDEQVQQYLTNFFKAIEPLQEKMGPVLWQLPRSLNFNRQRLEAFCSILPKGYNHVIEFRHPSWFGEDTYEILKQYKAGFCMVVAPGDLPEVVKATSTAAYLRFHGNETWYKDPIPETVLDEWAKALQSLNTHENWIFFNNTDFAYGAKNAIYLQEKLKDG